MPPTATLLSRRGASSDTIDVAQRVLLSTWLDLDNGGNELGKLIGMQQADGCWPRDSLFRYGRKQIFFGSRALSTAFAIAGVTQGLNRERARPASAPMVAMGRRSNVLAFPHS